MLTRRIPGSLSRVGVSIIAALLVMVASLGLLVWNTEAKSVSGGPGCGSNLAELLGIAVNGDTIQVLAGSNWDSNDAVITKNILIQGGWDLGTGTCISTDTTGFQFVWPAQRSTIVNNSTSPVAVIDQSVHSLTIQYVDFFNQTGATITQGAGIYGVISNSARVRLDNVVIRDSTANNGGGLYLEVRGGSQLILSNVQITGNQANEGSGFEIHVYDNSQVIIQSSTISGNIANNGGNGHGGRIVIHSGSVTLANNTFNNNIDCDGSPGCTPIPNDLLVEAPDDGPAYLILQNNSFSNDPSYSGNLTVLDKQTFLPLVRK